MKTEAERQLAELVSMPTISDDLTANSMAVDYIETYLRQRGMHVRRDTFDGYSALLASTRKDNLLTPTVLLAAHVDVVAAPEEMFTLRQEGDKLIGRGVYDMKFSIAGYMQVVDDLKDNLADYDFGIQIVTEEETYDRSTKYHVQAGLKPGVCILPDSTAPNYDIETLTKGYWRFDLTAKGKAAHGARPWEGESASFTLIQALHELKSHFSEQNVTSETINIGQIHGGHANNMVPSEMIAGLDIRYLNDKSLKKMRSLVSETCKKYNLKLKEHALAPPMITNLKHPLVKQYLKSVETITGRRPENFTSCAGSDGPYFYAGGIECIISCCKGGGHHTVDEWISRKSFLQFVPILHDYLSKTAFIGIGNTKQTTKPKKAIVAV